MTADSTETVAVPRAITAEYSAPGRRAFRSPVPDPDRCSPDDLLDYAANCRVHSDLRYDMTDDLKLALINLIERQDIKLGARTDEVAALRSQIIHLTRQLQDAQGLGTSYQDLFRDERAGHTATLSALVESIETGVQLVELRNAALEEVERMRAIAIRCSAEARALRCPFDTSDVEVTVQ